MARATYILCPVDFSEFSRRALDCAVQLARWQKARVVALHVVVNWPAVDVVPSLRGEPWPETFRKDVDRDAVTQCLETFVRTSAESPVEIDVRVVDAPNVVQEIVTQAEVLHASAIVIGSHGRSGFERLLLGSITEKVLRGARCPVMVVPRGAPPAPAGIARPFTRILCPVDFSCDALTALSRACDLARKAHGTVTVLNMIDVPAALYEMPGFDIEIYRRDAISASRRRLAEVVPEDTARRLDVIVSEGKPDQEILRVAADRATDLIVIGVHGRHAVDLAVFGSTTHRVIRGASCPVLTIRREEKAS
jgi:nucleotide-binding universal stress UspA family protein